MWVKTGMIVAAALVSGSLWLTNSGPRVEIVDKPDIVGDHTILSIREDAVPAVMQAFKSEAKAAEDLRRNSFVGTWTGDCGDLVQCDLKIEKAGDAYSLVLTVSDWQDAGNVFCRVTGQMHLGRSGQMVAGPLGSSPLSGVFLRGIGAIELHDAPNGDCSEANLLDGVYRIIGD